MIQGPSVSSVLVLVPLGVGEDMAVNDPLQSEAHWSCLVSGFNLSNAFQGFFFPQHMLFGLVPAFALFNLLFLSPF